MAEISIWARDDDESQGMRDRMADVSDLLRKGCRPSRKQSTPHGPSAGAGPPALHAVDDALQMLVEILEEGGLQANRAATEFGRCGGHMSLLQLLQAEDNDPATESTRELAARAVDLCMVHCSRFPMKAAALDAKNTCDTMQCTFLVDSPMNSCGGAKLMKSRALGMSLSSSVVTALAVHSWADLRSLAGALKLHLRRRPNPNDAESRAAITISNMLWAGSLVLVRYLQAFPDLIPSARFDKSPSKILEIGAGLGAGGLGAALLAKQMSKSAHVCITDCDPLAVQVIEAAIRCNGLAPSYPAVATDEICTSSANEGPDSGAKAPPVPARHSRGAPSNGVDASASVLDWDQIHSFTQASGGAKYDVILGAEVVHEMSHAAGVHRAIRELMAPGGCTIMVCGAAKHRFGVSEFQDLVRNDKLLAHSQQDAPASLTHDLESLRDDMLGLQIYTITWADARKAPIAEPVGIN